ncbi:hypothetical protein REMIM1_PE00296 (plasmid) [Rhizobium etli bv. mimosae str. Mim1]|nr:hypothetical protein REMIM1_PE00296 [Rhizobium etli bv. mimosae str. Mim1]
MNRVAALGREFAIEEDRLGPDVGPRDAAGGHPPNSKACSLQGGEGYAARLLGRPL